MDHSHVVAHHPDHSVVPAAVSVTTINRLVAYVDVLLF